RTRPYSRGPVPTGSDAGCATTIAGAEQAASHNAARTSARALVAPAIGATKRGCIGCGVMRPLREWLGPRRCAAPPASSLCDVITSPSALPRAWRQPVRTGAGERRRMLEIDDRGPERVGADPRDLPAEPALPPRFAAELVAPRPEAARQVMERM